MFNLTKLPLYRKGYANFLCPINLDKLKVRGHFGSPRFDYVEIMVRGCNLTDSSECLSDDKLSDETWNFVDLMAHPSLVANDQKAITYSTALTYFRFIDPTTTQNSNKFFMNSTVNFKGSIFDPFDVDENEWNFYEESRQMDYTKKIKESEPLAERRYVQIFLRAEDENRQYKREDYEVLAFLGDLGGLMDVVYLFGSALTHIFASKLFMAALVGQAYSIQRYLKDMTPLYQEKEKVAAESDQERKLADNHDNLNEKDDS